MQPESFVPRAQSAILIGAATMLTVGVTRMMMNNRLVPGVLQERIAIPTRVG